MVFFHFAINRKLCISGKTETKAWTKYTHELEIVPRIPYNATLIISTNLLLFFKIKILHCLRIVGIMWKRIIMATPLQIHRVFVLK